MKLKLKPPMKVMPRTLIQAFTVVIEGCFKIEAEATSASLIMSEAVV